jgi:hypothetical protein
LLSTAANARLASATAVPRCHKGKLVAGLYGHENASDQGGFILTLSASVSFGYTSKYPLHAAYLEITPPGAYRHLVVAIPDGTGNGSNGNLYVTALARHTAYQVTPRQCCEG